MQKSIVALSNLHLFSAAEEALQALSKSHINFPHDTVATNTTALIERTGQAEIILVRPGLTLSAAYFDACPSVKYIGVCGTSIDNIDLKAVNKQGITLINIKDYGDEPTAEFKFMQLISLLRGVYGYEWANEPHELHNKSIGIIGFGALGRAIAHVGLAYTPHVAYFSRTMKQESEVSYKDKVTLLSQSDILFITSPTDVIVINEQEFELIPDGTILVQASAGTCFDAAAFKKWTAHNGNYAIFDYAAGNENYKKYHDLPRVIFPKIIAGHSHETRERLGNKVVQELKAYLTK
ncbi:MAG TPA: NAD(P)-dependent oxidoreductase [Candidatus Saccharimonadales bacterium]|nr:NAD(P)-dependent oxidoreductase [Candidatus Saccharimonadales bacterium]